MSEHSPITERFRCVDCGINDGETTFICKKGDRRAMWQHKVCPRDEQLSLEMQDMSCLTPEQRARRRHPTWNGGE